MASGGIGEAETGNPGRLPPARNPSPGPCRAPPPGADSRTGKEIAMRGIGGSTLRGGQTVFHGIRMWGQMFQAALLFAAFMTVAVPAWTLWNRTTGAEWYAATMVTVAEVKLTLGYNPGLGSGGPLRRRHAACAAYPRRRRLRPGARGARADQGRDVRGRRARRDGRRRHDRGLSRRVLVSRRPARAAAAPEGRGAGNGARAAPADPGAPRPGCWRCCRAAGGSAPTGSPASPIRSAPRPSTPSSRAPRARARRC